MDGGTEIHGRILDLPGQASSSHAPPRNIARAAGEFARINGVNGLSVNAVNLCWIAVVDRRNNPYVPGAGLQPPELAGQDPLLADMSIDMDRVLAGRSHPRGSAWR